MEASAPGMVFDNKANRAHQFARSVEGHAIVPVEDAIAGLKKADRALIQDGTFTEFFESGKGMPTEPLKNLATAIRRGTDLIFSETKDLLGTKKRENFLPHSLTPAARLALEAQNGPIYDAIVRARPHVSKRDVVLHRGQDLPISQAGSAEFRRNLNLPRTVTVRTFGKNVQVELINSNPIEAFNDYAHQTARRAGVVREFGKGNTTMQDILKTVGENDPNLSLMLKQQWQTLQGIGDMPNFHTSAWGRFGMGAESIARTAQLSGSVLGNVFGQTQGARVWGIKNMARANYDGVRAWAADKWNPSWHTERTLLVQYSREHLGWARNGMDHLAQVEGMGGDFGLSKRIGEAGTKALNSTGLGFVENTTNRSGGLAAIMASGDTFNMLRKISTNPAKYNTKIRRVFGSDAGSLVAEVKRQYRFTDADIARIMKDGMGDADKARILQRAPALINQFIEGPNQRPRLMRHPMWQRALAYTSFMRLRGNMLGDALFHSRHGNMKPILKFLGWAALEGEAEIAFKGWWKNRERVDDGFVDRITQDMMAGMSFGYFGGVYENYKYSAGRDPLSRLWAVFAPPMVKWYGEASLAAGEIASTSYGKGFGEGIRVGRDKARRMAPALDILEAKRLQVFNPAEARKQRSARARQEKARNRWSK